MPAPLLVLLAGAVAIGFSPIFMRWSELGPVATAFYRIALALPLFFFWSRRIASNRRAEAPNGRGLLLLCGLLFAGDLAFWHWAVKLTSVANATLLANLAPFVVTSGAWLLFGQAPTRRFLLGLVLALLGAFLLLGHSVVFVGRQFTGDVFGLITALFYGAYLLTLSRLRRAYSTVSIMLSTGTVTALALLLLAWLTEPRLLPTTGVGVVVLLALSWISHAAGQGMITWSVAHLPINFSSVALLLQPVVAAIAAWLIFAEALGPVQIAGALLVLLGVAVSKRSVR